MSCVYFLIAVEKYNRKGTRLHWLVLVLLPIILFFTGCGGEIVSMLVYIKDNPISTILLAVGYILIGVVWSVVKWYFHLQNVAEDMRYIAPDLADDAYVKSCYDVSDNKERILNWMTYWPLSGAWTLVNDPVRKLFNLVFDRFVSIYQNMADKVFKDLVNKGELIQQERMAEIEKYKEEQAKYFKNK